MPSKQQKFLLDNGLDDVCLNGSKVEYRNDKRGYLYVSDVLSMYETHMAVIDQSRAHFYQGFFKRILSNIGICIHSYNTWSVMTEQDICGASVVGVKVTQGRRCYDCGKIQIKTKYNKF